MSSTTLSPAEIARYSRHLILPEVGLRGQETLKKSRVLLIGAGGLGSPLALYLAAAGVGYIGIVDFDVVDESNLQRQIIHGTSTLGKPKLESAKARLLDLNPHIEVELIQDRLSSANAIELFKRYDVVADGTDNFPTRYLVNDACVLTNTPNVYGSIFRFEGQVSVFHYEDGPCYRCLYSEPPPPGLVPSCAEGGVLGVLPGVVGCMQATEVVKVLLKIGTVAAGRLVMYDALNLKFRELKLRKDPHCKICSKTPEITQLIDYEAFCGVSQSSVNQNESPIEEISVQELKRLMDTHADVEVIDVREPHEYEIARIEGTTLFPLSTLPSIIPSLDPSKTYLIHCKSGVRSAKAVRQFLDAGIKNVKNVAGGILKWSEDIDASVPRY